MNSLIGLGAATSFLAGGASLVVPGVGLQSGFLEEPVMLLAIVLLGRNLEARARLRASGAPSALHQLPSLCTDNTKSFLVPHMFKCDVPDLTRDRHTVDTVVVVEKPQVSHFL